MKKLLWIGGLGLIFALPVWAADERDSAESEQRAESSGRIVEYVEVDVSALPTSNTVATKLPLPVQETPFNVGTVGVPLLREQRAIYLGDALQNISGVNVVGGQGVFDYFTVRGFDSINNALVMTDGAAEPEVSFYPMYNVEGVEVLKGPGGFLYGKDPMGGAVNIVRKQPLPVDFGRFTTSVGSFSSAEGTIDWNQAVNEGRQSFRINGMWGESDNWRNDKDSRQVAVNPGFAWKLGQDATLNLNLEYVNSEFSPDSGLPLIGPPVLAAYELADVPRRRSYQTPLDFSDQALYRFQVDFEKKLNDAVRIRNKTYYRDLDWETAGTLFNGVFPTGKDGRFEVSRTLTLLDDRQKSIGNQLEAILTFDSGPVAHNLLAGVELARLSDDFGIDLALPEDQFPGGVPEIDLLDPVETTVAPFSFPFLVGDHTTQILAPYVIDQMKLSEQFRLLVGLRYDSIDTEVDYDVDQLNPGSVGFDRDDSGLSPMAGLTYLPNDALAFYANAGQAFSPIGPRVRGAAALEPEDSRQAELGVRKQFKDGKYLTTLAVYQIERENMAITDPDNFATQQAGDQRSRGVEVELAAELWPRLRALFSYAFTDAELTSFNQQVRVGPNPEDVIVVDRSGNSAAFAPEHLVNLWLSHTFTNGLGIGGGARYFSEQFIDESNAFELDSALVLRGTVFYDWGNCRVKLNVENLTDEEYEVPGFTSTVMPAKPFSAYGGFEYRF